MSLESNFYLLKLYNNCGRLAILIILYINCGRLTICTIITNYYRAYAKVIILTDALYIIIDQWTCLRLLHNFLMKEGDSRTTKTKANRGI